MTVNNAQYNHLSTFKISFNSHYIDLYEILHFEKNPIYEKMIDSINILIHPNKFKEKDLQILLG